jgi:DNA-binding SARP family transcriptional activator
VLEIDLLGPVQASVDRVDVPLSPLERNLLAVLALAPGKIISTERMIDQLWGHQVPASPRSRVQGLVSSLRRKVGDVLLTRSPGYLLDAAKLRVDVVVCERLAGAASTAQSAAEAAGLFRQALRLWRGEPLDGVWAPGTFADRTRLAELRIGLIEARFDAELSAGNHAEIVGELAAAVSDHPLRERLAGQHMLALYRCNRQADALLAYQALRSRLAEELGSDPCQDLRALHTMILRGGEVAEPPSAEPSPAGTEHRPAQLPPTVGYFTGREGDLAALRAALVGRRDEPRVLIVSGPGGLGKTALVVQWAHGVADRFPHGQIFLDLRGDEPAEALPVCAALEAVLGALDVARADLPPTTTERVALYRTLVNGKRMMIVADNAASAEQLLPLVPSTSDSLLVVTSRRRLTALASYHAVDELLLEPLPARSSLQLLEKLVGAQRLRDPAVADLLSWCGGWPLAIRLAGAKLAVRPSQPLASFVEDLRDCGDELVLDGDRRSVHSVLNSAYRSLSPAAARLFGRLSLYQGAHAHLRHAVAAAGTSARRARQLVDELITAHLVVESGADGYSLHDVIRRFAVRRCAEEEWTAPAEPRLDRPIATVS